MNRIPTRSLRVTVIVLAALSGGCGRTEIRDIPEPAPEQTGPRPDSEQWNAVIQLYEQGLKKSVIISDYLAVYQLPGNSRTRLDTLEVDFFDAEGEETSHLIADSGEIYDQDLEGRRRVKTWGGVVLTGPEGQVVRADTLWWEEAEDRLHTDGPVQVTREGDILNAIGFESNTKLEDMHLGQVSGSSMQGGEWVDDERVSDRSATADTSRAARLDTSGTVRPDSTRTIPPDPSGTALPPPPATVPRDTFRTVVPDTSGLIPPDIPLPAAGRNTGSP
jgi:LPS export ABC transporter protein LptC